MKRWFAFFMSFVLICTAISAPTVCAEETEADSPLVSAKSAVLIDAQSGMVLYEKNPHEPLPPASITKVMTLLLVAEAIENNELALTDMVKASAHAVSMGGSQIWLKENEEMTVDDLLKATAIGSANDASMALAEHVAGTEEAFVALMNKRAKELGMNNTVFKNPTGLDADGHVSTAYDIALMSKELLTHETVTPYLSVWMDTLRGGQTQLVNTNKLVRFYNGCIGVKTGTTDGAGSCLSAAAVRNDVSLISVVMGCATSAERFDSARALLNYGFASFVRYTPATTTDTLPALPVIHGTSESVSLSVDSSAFLIQKADQEAVTESVSLPESINAPVKQGQEVGTLTITAGKITQTIPICASADVPKMGLWSAICLMFSRVFAFR